MISNPKARKVLCFGDSLTWGHFHSGIRFALKDRWTYKLQELLGSDFDVVEEGLRSRTTNIDDIDVPGRNGFTYFRACFESQDPVDILIYMLGTNDTKVKFHRDAAAILAGITETIDWIDSRNKDRKIPTKIMLIAPPQINLKYLKNIQFDKTSNDKLIQLASRLSEFAKKRNLLFLDLSEIIGAENDGVHLTVEDNAKIARRIATLILESNLSN